MCVALHHDERIDEFKYVTLYIMMTSRLPPFSAFTYTVVTKRCRCMGKLQNGTKPYEYELQKVTRFLCTQCLAGNAARIFTGLCETCVQQEE